MIGQTIGSYRITARVARGGQATLYRAVHVNLGRDAALKILHPHLIGDADFRLKFEAEGRILARLKHPNIVAVYDAGKDQGYYYIAMEWLDGKSVDRLIEQHGKLPVDQAVRIADQVAAALEYAHAREYAHTQGLIHRDIKPGNMMLLSDGTVKVLDFGIAAIVAAGQKAKTRIGTIEYMPLEQANGQADQRSDIYSLGASLYHMLAGECPPPLAAHPPKPLCKEIPAVPASLETLIYRTLSRDLDGRPQTMAILRQELQTVISGSPSHASAFFCPDCGTRNRPGARYCPGCGEFLVSKLIRPGTMLAGRYEITSQCSEPRSLWDVMSYEATDTRTGAQCWVIPMGADPIEDKWMSQLATLHHRALPKMEVVTHRGIACFISYGAQGVPFRSIKIQGSSELVSIGLQLCELLEKTGSLGDGFPWSAPQASHVMLTQKGQIFLDAFQYCRDWLRERRLDIYAKNEDRLMPMLLGSILDFPFVQRDGLLPAELAVAEVGIVGGAMIYLLTGSHPFLIIERPLQLAETMPDLPHHVEQAAIASVMRLRVGSQPWIGSVRELQQHLRARVSGPAHGMVSPTRVDLGQVSWGESPSFSVQLASRDSGVLYGAVASAQAGVSARPRHFAAMHPAQIDVKLVWDTSRLDTCGTVNAKVLITTRVDSFSVNVSADVQPNPAFHLKQANAHLRRKEWKDAIHHCDELIALQPHDHEGYWLRGQACHANTQYAEAIRDYTKALQLDPADRTKILNKRGRAYLGLRKYDLSIRDYSEAIALEPGEPAYHWNRSIVYEEQGQKHLAISDMQTYLSLGGRDTEGAQRRLSSLQKGGG